MDLDEFLPRSLPVKPRDLSGYSVADLEDYIARLEGEIARARELIASKQSARVGAEAWFKR